MRKQNLPDHLPEAGFESDVLSCPPVNKLGLLVYLLEQGIGMAFAYSKLLGN